MADPVQAVALDKGFQNYWNARADQSISSPASDALRNGARQVVEEELRLFNQLKNSVSTAAPGGKFTNSDKRNLFQGINDALDNMKNSLENIKNAKTAGEVDKEMRGLNDFRKTFLDNVVGDKEDRYQKHPTFGSLVKTIGGFYSNGNGLDVVSAKPLQDKSTSPAPGTTPITPQPNTPSLGAAIGKPINEHRSLATKLAKNAPADAPTREKTTDDLVKLENFLYTEILDQGKAEQFKAIDDFRKKLNPGTNPNTQQDVANALKANRDSVMKGADDRLQVSRNGRAAFADLETSQ